MRGSNKDTIQAPAPRGARNTWKTCTLQSATNLTEGGPNWSPNRAQTGAPNVRRALQTFLCPTRAPKCQPVPHTGPKVPSPSYENVGRNTILHPVLLSLRLHPVLGYPSLRLLWGMNPLLDMTSGLLAIRKSRKTGPKNLDFHGRQMGAKRCPPLPWDTFLMVSVTLAV